MEEYPKQKLDLFEMTSGSSAQFRARPAEIAGRQALNPGTVPLMQDDFPSPFCTKRRAGDTTSFFLNRAKYLLLCHLRRCHPKDLDGSSPSIVFP
jgi:hypothetical protein